MNNESREQLKNNLSQMVAAGEAGLQLDTPFRWLVTGVKEPAPFFKHLSLLLPSDSILYFEGCAIGRDVVALFEHHAAPNPVMVARDTVFPVPECFHVAFSRELVNRLCELAETRPLNELFDHVKGYQGKRLLFHFHDAFDNDLLISEWVGEDALREFCNALGATYRREPNVNKAMEGLQALLKAMENPSKVRIAGEPWWRRFWRRMTWR